MYYINMHESGRRDHHETGRDHHQTGRDHHQTGRVHSGRDRERLRSSVIIGIRHRHSHRHSGIALQYRFSLLGLLGRKRTFTCSVDTYLVPQDAVNSIYYALTSLMKNGVDIRVCVYYVATRYTHKFAFLERLIDA